MKKKKQIKFKEMNEVKNNLHKKIVIVDRKEKEYSDIAYITLTTTFTLWDRIKILFGANSIIWMEQYINVNNGYIYFIHTETNSKVYKVSNSKKIIGKGLLHQLENKSNYNPKPLTLERVKEFISELKKNNQI